LRPTFCSVSEKGFLDAGGKASPKVRISDILLFGESLGQQVCAKSGVSFQTVLEKK
jgi:hypothetical protein